MREHHRHQTLRRGAQLTVLVLALFWFTFAALSGAENGLAGFWANLPNTLPWVALLAVLLVSLRWPVVGGTLIIAAGIGALVYFNAWENLLLLAALVLPLVASGVALILSQWPVLGQNR
ncbi:MAG: hypothetical protein JJ908_13350 [Rhizobiales bacterium]|nr:hypothetical protein [Hyphomicrobiales bacterium]MBO6699811.1 hypothetical protein [Hyphomicrobiales bacterium]MBO6737349.1 hypothetical protein [Hyphomicrobiales bacterium]MBO6911577.1 hypothetical protein [Hyphomicrobiales bacterium]MBO6955123.1 hypothetical protein [Hyphomicrobiales bacterium]